MGKKKAAAVALLLLIPVLFIVMLPSLIFGGLTSRGAPEAEQPVLNDDAAIVEQITDVVFSINQILGEGIDDVTERIGEHFTTTNGDAYEIVNPYEGNLVSNSNLLLSEYCAAKDQDWRGISLNDMEKTLAAGKSHLYSFTYETEVRTAATRRRRMLSRPSTSCGMSIRSPITARNTSPIRFSVSRTSRRSLRTISRRT